MAETYEILFPVLTAAVALVPLVAVGRAWLRVRSTRLLLATLAFLSFVTTGVVLAFLALLGLDTGNAPEQVEFGSDIVTVSLFALSFLWPRAEPDAS